MAPGHGLPPGDGASPDPSAKRPVSGGQGRRSGRTRRGCRRRTTRSRRPARRRRFSRFATSCRHCRSRRGWDGRSTAWSTTRELIDRVFASVGTSAMAAGLLQDLALRSPTRAADLRGPPRNVTVTLCGDRRGRTPMHTVAVGGRDRGAAAALEAIGLTVRPAKAGSVGWRYESCFKDYGAALDVGRPHRRGASGPGAPGRAAGAARAGGRGQQPAVRRGAERPSRHGHVRRARRLRRRRTGGADPARRKRLRPRRRRHAQLRRRGPRHPQLHLRLPRRRHPEHPRVRGHLPRGPRGAAGAELPLHADHPQRRERGGRQQPRAQGQVAVDGDRRGRHDQGPGAGRRARRGAVRGGGDRAARGRGGLARRARRSSTAPTRSPACSRTCWCARRSATR